MIQPEITSPRQKGISKSLKGKPKVKNSIYARSRSKRESKGEQNQHPLTYPGSIGYQL